MKLPSKGREEPYNHIVELPLGDRLARQGLFSNKESINGQQWLLGTDFYFKSKINYFVLIHVVYGFIFSCDFCVSFMKNFHFLNLFILVDLS